MKSKSKYSKQKKNKQQKNNNIYHYIIRIIAILISLALIFFQLSQSQINSFNKDPNNTPSPQLIECYIQGKKIFTTRQNCQTLSKTTEGKNIIVPTNKPVNNQKSYTSDMKTYHCTPPKCPSECQGQTLTTEKTYSGIVACCSLNGTYKLMKQADCIEAQQANKQQAKVKAYNECIDKISKNAEKMKEVCFDLRDMDVETSDDPIFLELRKKYEQCMIDYNNYKDKYFRQCESLLEL